MTFTLSPELIVGILTIVGTILLVLHKLGLLVFGKKCKEDITEGQECLLKRCPDHERVVRDAALAVKEAKLTSDQLSSSIMTLKEDIKDIKGILEQRDNINQAEFRRLRELIGDLSGYVRGITDARTSISISKIKDN